MKLSNHNIISKIKDSSEFYIVNPLSGNADIITSEEAKTIVSQNDLNTQELAEKGYYVDEIKEQKELKNKYLNFIEERDQDETQIFFVTNYSCNFACSYCYQEEYTTAQGTLTKVIVDAFFHYLEKEFAGKKKYITLFGGEPLLPGNTQKELISYIVEKTNAAGLDLCVVTNGFTLTEYIDILKKASLREIQVTLDGTQPIHDSRRFLKGRKPTFDKIVEGIDACLAQEISVNLRVVADKENIGNLPELAQLAIDKGWTKSPLFKTQIGRNYELHHCNSSPEKLFSRISLYETIFALIKKHPYIEEFYKPAYCVSKYISENGELPKPLFDSCPACKTEWAFDFTGTIYSCTATVGKKDEELGTFYPSITKNEASINLWQERDVLSIKECRTCNVQLACGGGCGAVAKNKNGHLLSPDCRPVKELLEMGFAQYLVKK